MTYDEWTNNSNPYTRMRVVKNCMTKEEWANWTITMRNRDMRSRRSCAIFHQIKVEGDQINSSYPNPNTLKNRRRTYQGETARALSQKYLVLGTFREGFFQDHRPTAYSRTGNRANDEESYLSSSHFLSMLNGDNGNEGGDTHVLSPNTVVLTENGKYSG
jgi:hypothetical protein